MSFYTHSDIIEAKMCNNCAIKKHQFIFVYLLLYLIHLGAVLLTVGRSYIGNDITHVTLLDRACACSMKIFQNIVPTALVTRPPGLAPLITRCINQVLYLVCQYLSTCTAVPRPYSAVVCCVICVLLHTTGAGVGA